MKKYNILILECKFYSQIMRRHTYQENLWHILTTDDYTDIQSDKMKCIQLIADPIKCTYQPTNTRMETSLKSGLRPEK